MIDTHCHLLPALDDGPADEAAALDLAHALVADGIDRVVCTPHYSSLFPTDEHVARERYAALRRNLEVEKIPLRVELAAEIGPGHAVTAPLDVIERRSIAGKFALVEVQPEVAPTFFLAVVERLHGAGLRIVFGHPERSDSLAQHLDLVDELRQEGCLMQIVAPSLLGRWGSPVARLAWRLVDTGRADLLASDAHGTRRRRVHLREAGAAIGSRVGAGVAEQLTIHGPAALLDGSEAPA